MTSTTPSSSSRVRPARARAHARRRRRVRRPRHRHQARRARVRRLPRRRQGAAPSAAPGATTPTPAPPATCPASSTRSASRPTPTGRAPSPRSRRSRPTSSAPPRESGVLDRFRFGVTVRGRRLGRGRAGLARRAPTTATSSPTSWSPARAASPSRKLPEIEGIDSFAGEIFHSARWNHDYDLTGKRVAVIGTGASAIQIVPEIAEQVAHLDVYQRTAPWVMPRNDRDYTGDRAVRASGTCRSCRRPTAPASTGAASASCPGFTVNPKLAAPAKKLALQNIERGISDPALREAVTPDFQIGCKRILISNDYYPALDSDHVDLVTDGIREITPTGIVTGRRHRARGRRDHRGDRLLHDRAADRRAHQGSRRPHARRLVARERHGGVQGHHDRRLPQPVPDRRPQHRPGPLLDGVHHREPDRLHPLRPPADGRARDRRRRADARRRRTPGTPTSSAGCSAPCGAPAAARAGTSTPTAATPPCGRAPPSSSASCCETFDLDQYVVDHRDDATSTTKENAA